jgi:hypothetical protein
MGGTFLPAILALALGLPGPLGAQGNFLPEGFFDGQPPLGLKDIELYDSFLDLLLDDTFERSFLETKLAKDFKIKPERVRYCAVRMTILLILEANRNREEVVGVMMRNYGPKAFPTEGELLLSRPSLPGLAKKLNQLGAPDVADLPYLHYLFKL